MTFCLETLENREDEAASIQRLREALCKEKNLKSKLDDKFLLKFLRARKFDHDRTLSLIKNYYKQRIKYPDLYKNVRLSSFPDVVAIRGIGKLSDKDPEGRTVFFATLLDEWEPSKIPVSDILKCSLMALELASEDEEAQINGFTLLIDAADFGFKHLRCFDLFTITQFVSVTVNSFPAKFKQLHVINAPRLFKILFSMVKPFLNKKLKRRFQFHGNELSNLYQELPREILPEEFGGHLGPIDCSEWAAKLLVNDAVIERDSIYGYIAD